MSRNSQKPKASQATATVGNKITPKPRANVVTATRSGRTTNSTNDENERPYAAIGSGNVAAARTLLQLNPDKSSTAALRDITNYESFDENEERNDRERELTKISKPHPIRNPKPVQAMDTYLSSDDDDEEIDYTKTHSKDSNSKDSPKTYTVIKSPFVSGDPFYLGPIRSLEILNMCLAAKAELEKSNYFKGLLLTKRTHKLWFVTHGIGKDLIKIDVRELIDCFKFIINYFMLHHFAAEEILDQVYDKIFKKTFFYNNIYNLLHFRLLVSLPKKVMLLVWTEFCILNL